LVADQECTNERVGRDGAALVRDAMVGRPKTLPAGASVDDLRALFANPHVRTALLVDGDRFAGAVERDDVPASADGTGPARALATMPAATVEPDTPLAEAQAILDADANHRLVVLDADGATLRGLLCLTTDRTGFCQS
jgi:CBS domain-containing protein